MIGGSGDYFQVRRGSKVIYLFLIRIRFLNSFCFVVFEKQVVKVLTICHGLYLPLKVADHVVMMDCYSCHDVTDKAKVNTSLNQA